MSVIVIGGGAAGMMAALAAAQAGASVRLLEKNEKLGKKVYITGKGRCNVTNTADEENFRAHVLRNPRFLYSSYRDWDNRAVMRLLEEAGLPLKTERGGRVFPQSDKSSDVIAAFKRLLEKAGVQVCLHTEVKKILVKDGRVIGVLTKTPAGAEKIPADRVILATGGLSYPATGSTGDGYRMAKELGHSVTPLFPSLVPLGASFAPPVRDHFRPEDLAGLSLKNVTLTARAGGKKLYEELGEMLFTHFGVSGPLVLSCSARLGDALAAGKAIVLSVDLKPGMTAEQLDARLVRDIPAAGSKQLSSLMGAYLPKALIPVVLCAAGLPEKKKAAELTREERQALGAALKDLRLDSVSLRDYPEAIVTRGGIPVKEVDPKTMASKSIENLYFAGEILDLDAETGGFNLQIAWTSGHAAGTAAGLRDGAGALPQKEKNMRKNRNIAIDGPASSGKSTIAKLIAKETGLIYVDTGAMYRAMAIYFLRKGLDAADEAGITEACADADVTIRYENGVQQVYLNGENVTPYLREQATGQMASASSVYSAVREKMKALQQQLAREQAVVMDGRDIGTVILPDAGLKIYMTASVEVRAKRRCEELLAKGEEADYEAIAKEISERDYRDMHREIAPLKRADDAILLDTSDLSIEEVKDAVLKLYRGEA